MRICSIAVGIGLLLSGVGLAQSVSTGSISGMVVSDSSKQPLEYVNVVLLSLPDSTLVTGTTTNRKGTFRIVSLPIIPSALLTMGRALTGGASLGPERLPACLLESSAEASGIIQICESAARA
jgi:hypothetical protein